MRYLFAILIIAVLGIVVFLGNSGSRNIEDAETPRENQTGEAKSQNTEIYLSIPSLNITAPIIFINSAEEAEIQNALKNGAVHYAGSALPGEFGNAYIVGHSSDSPFGPGSYKTVFARLPEIELASQIKISYQGNEYIYEVTETKAVEADDLSVLDQPVNRKLLTLQTSYPVGTALKRFIIVAELDVSPR